MEEGLCYSELTLRVPGSVGEGQGGVGQRRLMGQIQRVAYDPFIFNNEEKICCRSGPRLGDRHMLFSLILTTLKVDHLGPFIYDCIINQPPKSDMTL